MKKIITAVLVSILVLAVPLATQAQAAQKEINADTKSIPIRNKSGTKTLAWLPKNAIFTYHGSGKLTWKGVTGYSSLTSYFAPTSSNGWYAAVSKYSFKAPESINGKGVISVAQNEVVRVCPSSEKSGWIKMAVLNDGWEWTFWVKKANVIRVDGFAVNSQAWFTNL
ncbi:hypothetical protein [Listeria booriae]|uniref:hypothetical protein n=1 Tax=Listeria booriae TaxID=1552123 RepID=UPI001623F663|nr:hypothetical protein [Listeria booriae]MBC1307876.1 hypothetical protein [Listeria booriae]MBC2391385.1 hypothetical protein [Listeria booriae]